MARIKCWVSRLDSSGLEYFFLLFFLWSFKRYSHLKFLFSFSGTISIIQRLVIINQDRVRSLGWILEPQNSSNFWPRYCTILRIWVTMWSRYCTISLMWMNMWSMFWIISRMWMNIWSVYRMISLTYVKVQNNQTNDRNSPHQHSNYQVRYVSILRQSMMVLHLKISQRIGKALKFEVQLDIL